jgi:hypothetical protein
MQKEALGLPLGVVRIPLEMSHGVDIRFKQDAVVFIIQLTEIESEDLHQMIARGCRSLGTKEANLYCVAHPAAHSAIKAELEAGPTLNFQ